MGFSFQVHTIRISTTLDRWNNPTEKKPRQPLGSGGFSNAADINHGVEWQLWVCVAPSLWLLHHCNTDFDQMTLSVSALYFHSNI